jgi:hypothetical protein
LGSGACATASLSCSSATLRGASRRATALCGSSALTALRRGRCLSVRGAGQNLARPDERGKHTYRERTSRIHFVNSPGVS